MSTSDREGTTGFVPGVVHDVRTIAVVKKRYSSRNEASTRASIIADADRTWLGFLVKEYTGLNVNVVAYTDRNNTLHVSVVTANAKVHQITFACAFVAERNKSEIYNALELAGFPCAQPVITPAEAVALGEAAFADVLEGQF